MAGVKISGLGAIPSAALTDLVAEVQGGTTYKATLQKIATLFEAELTNLSGITGEITAPTAITGDAAMVIRTGTTAADAVTLSAYDVGGAAYTVFGTLTAHATTPTFVLDGASVTNIPNTGLTVMDTDASHALSIVPGSNLTAARTLNLVGSADLLRQSRDRR